MTTPGWERFEALARKARQEPVPPIDVRRSVAATVASLSVASPATGQRVLAVLAGLSMLAASVMLTVSFDAWGLLVEPPATLWEPLSWVLL